MKSLSSLLSNRPLAALALAALCLLGFSACADEEIPRDNTAMLPADQQVSTMPWNQRESWEKTSQLGSLAQDPHIGGSGTTGGH